MTDEQVRAIVREADHNACDEYATQILISKIPSEKTWLVTAEHGDPVKEKAVINRYVVREGVKITPVTSFLNRTTA